jgi:hypothetical protein
MNHLPKRIEAWEYEETCGNKDLGGGIIMLDENKDEICRLPFGTVREAAIARLWQTSIQLLAGAKEACREQRALKRSFPAPWLASLEETIREAEGGEIK